MPTNVPADCIQAEMSARRELVKGVLGDCYQERVAVYVKTVKNVMAEKGINEMTAALEIITASNGRFDPVTCALISAAALEIIDANMVAEVDKQSSEPGSHLSSLFYPGGMTRAVLVDGCERREGTEHE